MIKKIKYALRSKYKCTICSDEIAIHYNPMKEWSIDGVLCGDCYSKKLSDFYPGEHARINKE